MASAARLTSLIEEPPSYADDLKPTMQLSESSPQEFLYAHCSTASSPPVNHEPMDNFPSFSFIASRPSPTTIPTFTPTSSHVIPSVDPFAFPAPLPQRPPLLASWIHKEYLHSVWSYPSTYEASCSPQTKGSYQRERENFAQSLPLLNHTTSSQANCFPGPCSSYTHDRTSDFYHPIDNFRWNNFAASAHRIVYPQAVSPRKYADPYSRRVQSTSSGAGRPFSCEKCGAGFNRKYDLKRHAGIHLEVKPFPCGWCEKAFSRRDALKRHLTVKACSGSKEVSVEESLRRAEQARITKSDETLA